MDNSVIATGFAQLVDEGLIDVENKKTVQLAIDRQIIWVELSKNWQYSREYISNLKLLVRALKGSIEKLLSTRVSLVVAGRRGYRLDITLRFSSELQELF